MIRGVYGEMELWNNLTAAQAELNKFNHRYPNMHLLGKRTKWQIIIPTKLFLTELPN
jgi:hypothetical protein